MKTSKQTKAEEVVDEYDDECAEAVNRFDIAYLMRCWECGRVFFFDDCRIVSSDGPGSRNNCCPHCKSTTGPTSINPDGTEAEADNVWRGVSRSILIALAPALAPRIGFGIDGAFPAERGLLIGGAK